MAESSGICTAITCRMGYGHGYGHGYGSHHHGGFHVAFGLGFGYYPYYYDPYYAYPAYYPGYIAPYGSTVIHETTIIDDRPITVVDPVAPVEGAITAAPAPFAAPPAATTDATPTAPRPTAPVPGSLEDLLGRGDYAFAQGQYAQARALYMQAAVVGPDSPHPKFAYALAGFALGDYKAAAVSLRQAMRLFPDLARSEADLREAYRIPGDFERHLNALAEYTNVKDDDPDGWLVLGYIQYFSAARAAGLTSLGKALELAPNDDVVRAFFDTARATPTPPTARPFPPLDPKMQPGDSAPPKSTQPSEGTKPAERNGTSRSDVKPVPDSPVTGSAPGVSVEFSPPASTAKPQTSTETNPA